MSKYLLIRILVFKINCFLLVFSEIIDGGNIVTWNSPDNQCSN